EKAIKKIQNEFLELSSTIDYLNSLEEKYTKTFHEKVQTFYDENYSKIVNSDLKKFYTEWKDKLLEIENPFINSSLSQRDETNFLFEFIKSLIPLERRYTNNIENFKNTLFNFYLKEKTFEHNNCL
ncbi:hypothetical protein, partial [Mycoplasmopsis pullorum]|uniref:hypothetical protein n=1 Tax=Mycoplasmopsis pullorum TaxID=48003 RepID=UPI0015D59DE9